eukprot:scaffold157158_cov22-Tisochrysis_lutea.AAC.1
MTLLSQQVYLPAGGAPPLAVAATAAAGRPCMEDRQGLHLCHNPAAHLHWAGQRSANLHRCVWSRSGLASTEGQLRDGPVAEDATFPCVHA